jgi:ornithine cyclodeaminase/alanine dehydrogenase
MDCTWITAMRTGAATSVAAKYLARKDSSTVGILACGVQGRTNLEALSCLFDIKHVRVYDLYPEIAEKFAREMGEKLHIEIRTVSKPQEAVKGLDMVVTSCPILKNPTPIIVPGWLKRGGFASPVDFDSSWQGDAFREADKLATDDTRQMEYYRHEGYFRDTPAVYADLGEIAAGKKPARESDEERIICINLGLALDDMAVAITIYSRACEMGIGSVLPL